MAAYFAFFTELPMHVFNLLKPEANQLSVEDFLNCDSLISPEIVHLMLNDLHLKLKFALYGRNEINTAENKERLMGVNFNGYYKLAIMSQGQIGQSCMKLFPLLVEIAQAIVDHVASLSHENNPIDGKLYKLDLSVRKFKSQLCRGVYEKFT